jgi:putative sigma-54 modulation protein
MRVTVKGKNLEVSEPLRLYAEKKVDRLGRYFHNIREAIVTEKVEKNRQIVEIQLEGDGVVLRAQESSDSMYASIDLAVEKLDHQVRRFKGKLIERVHPQEPPKELAALAAEGAEQELWPTPEIVKTKRISLKPISTEEAAMQMEMLNHDFFVFLNSETEAVSVLYLRNDGNYGLIEPE